MQPKHQAIIKHFIQLKKEKKYRNTCQSLLIEGQKLIKELAPHHHVKKILTKDLSLVPQGIDESIVELLPVHLIEKISLLEQSEGILAEVVMPPFESVKNKNKIIVFDGIQDPGNLGTLIRSALAFGFDGAIILPGTVDPFNDKALRAARGATFFLPIQQGGLEEIDDRPFLIADLEGLEVKELPPMPKFVLIMGNEAHGPSLHRSGSKITIKMQSQVESLNVGVAGSIIMYLLASK